jgi:hypothetical protein
VKRHKEKKTIYKSRGEAWKSYVPFRPQKEPVLVIA